MYNQKKVMVVGLAKSGIPAVKLLKALGATVILHDSKTEDQLETFLEALKGQYDAAILGRQPEGELDLDLDLMVLSPGVPTDLPFILKAKANGIPVIGELELGYTLAQGRFFGITGTNGKTTTTALTGDIFMAAGLKTHVVGNIGIPVVDKALDSDPQTCFVTEVSSFQLESIDRFACEISAILNFTPDHLNRHKTMENYIAAKCRIFENKLPHQKLVLNLDNAGTRTLGQELKDMEVVWFSRLEQPTGGVYVLEGNIVVEAAGEKVFIMPVEEIFIPGPHNLENVLAAVAISYHAGIAPAVIRSAVKAFKGIAHRVEFVKTHKGVTYYNDSKGTNPDSSIKAVEAMKQPTYLIAGGMDKGSTFDELIKAFNGRILELVVFGETASIIENTAYKHGYNAVKVVSNLDEAVAYCSQKASEGQTVLLSPACASWDMYPSFEVRGDHFKSLVNALE